MKKITMIIAALCLMGMTAMAQNEGGRPGKMDSKEMVKKMDAGMAKAISGLDKEQLANIHELNTTFVAQMEKNRPEMKEGERPSQEDMQTMRTAMEKSRTAYKTALKGILTQEQFTAYEKYEKTQMQHRGGHGGHGGAGQGGQQDAPQN